MIKLNHYLLLIIALLLNPVIAAESDLDIWQHQSMPECHSVDCGMDEPEVCGNDCDQLVAGCCSSLSSVAVAISHRTVLKRSKANYLSLYRDNYLSVIPPPLYHPPRQIL